MRKKDYLLIAGGLYAAKLGAKTDEERFGVRLAVDNVLANLQNENHNFDTQKFLTACGIETGCQHKRTAPAHDPDMRKCLDCDRLVKAPEQD